MVLSAAILALAAGCEVREAAPPAAVVAVQSPNVIVQDDYVYYPSYGVYYSSGRHQYAYQENGGWVSRPEPRGVSVNVLQASPSVRMDFHDPPAQHHAAISRQYPKNWKAPVSDKGGNEKRQDDKGGERTGR